MFSQACVCPQGGSASAHAGKEALPQKDASVHAGKEAHTPRKDASVHAGKEAPPRKDASVHAWKEAHTPRKAASVHAWKEATPHPRRDGYCCGQYASYWNAFLFGIIFAENYMRTRMHSSRMHTGCSLTICQSLLPGGVSAPRGSAPGGVSGPGGGGVWSWGCLLQGVSGLGGCLLWGVCSWGVSALGVCSGGYSSMH